MLRFILLSLLLTILLRALNRLWAGFVQGMRGQSAAGGPFGARTPPRSVHMARDPVCGTFVVPERAAALVDGAERLYFCSTTCRDTYLAQHSRSRSAAAHGRPA